MGYWSEHPMGGDYPQDLALDVYYYIIKKENMTYLDDFFEGIDEQKRREILNKYKHELLYNMNDYGFVIPYIFIDYSIRFDDQKDLDKIKDLMNDGGAVDRGYDEDEFGPHIYAEALKRNVEYIFSSKYTTKEAIKLIPKEDLELLYDKGLIETIIEDSENNTKGLINKK